MLTVTYSGGFKNPSDYKSFKDYWDDHKESYKRIKCRNIIWRIIHYKKWICRDGYLVWKDFLFYASPIVPAKLKAYASYRYSLKMWKRVTDHMVDDMTESINKEILNDIMNMTTEELNEIIKKDNNEADL